MKTLKLSLLLCLGMLLSVGSIQAQAKKACKKSCKKTCTKAKTAQVETSDATATLMVSQESGKTMKNCDPKNCPPGCDISKCNKGAKAAAGNGTTTTPVMKVGQKSGKGLKNCDPANCPPGCCKGEKACKTKTTSAEKTKTKAMAVKSSME